MTNGYDRLSRGFSTGDRRVTSETQEQLAPSGKQRREEAMLRMSLHTLRTNRTREAVSTLFVALIVAFTLATGIDAQTGKRLSRIQEEARDYLRLVQVQMETLSERLSIEKPEDASRLRIARERIVRDLLIEDMRNIAELLEDEDYVPALETVSRVSDNLEAVIALLQDRSLSPEDVDEKLQQIEQTRQAIGQFTEKQQELRNKTQSAEQASRDLETITDAQREISDLLQEQNDLEGLVDEESQDLTQSNEQLDSIRNDTARLAGELARQARQQESLDRLKERLDSLAGEARRDAAQGDRLLDENSAEDLKSDPQAMDLGERSGDRSREAGQLKQSVRAMLRESGTPQSNSDRVRDNSLAQAEEALEQAAEAAQRASGSQRSDPKGAQKARQQESSALARAQEALERASRNSGPSSWQERVEELANRFGEWSEEDGNLRTPHSEEAARDASQRFGDAQRALSEGEDRSSSGRHGQQQSGQHQSAKKQSANKK